MNRKVKIIITSIILFCCVLVGLLAKEIKLNHVASDNVKKVEDKIVDSKEKNGIDIGVNLINTEKNIKTISAEEIHGSSNILSIADIIDVHKTTNAIVMGRKGEIRHLNKEGYIECIDNRIDYIESDTGDRMKDIVGIILDPPSRSIMDAFYDTSSYLKNENVLFLFLDGFGYHQYEYAIENGYAPFLKTISKGEKVLSVYRPVTNAGFAAMITGKSPHENGVYSRKQRELKVDSIFKVSMDLGKKPVLIEGHIAILNTEISPILNIDRNKNNSTDDEVFECAKELIEEDYNLIFVHLHGIDDSGHSYGDLHDETMKTIKRNDEYLEYLVSNWKGKVIITSDHGMHSTNTAGNHGEFRYEDMIVPYIVLEGGIKDE